MLRLLPLSLAILVTLSSSIAYGQTWATGLFKETSHNFGVVARAAKTKHVFEFTNTTGSTIHISGARTSCNCAIPRVLTHTVEPGQVGRIETEFNTLAFKGQRGANVTVTFTSPSYTEVQLRIDGYIRGDIVIDPGAIAFGDIIAGSDNERTVNIRYAGKTNWQIQDIKSPHEGIKTELVETRREGMYIDYSLKVWLDKSYPAGYLNQQLLLVTNDAARKNVPLMVTGKVQLPIQVPSVVDVGRIKSGETVKKVVVVKALRSFTVLGVSNGDSRIEVTQPQDSKKTHLLRLTINANSEGDVDDELILKTDDPAMPEAKIKIMGSVISDAK